MDTWVMAGSAGVGVRVGVGGTGVSVGRAGVGVKVGASSVGVIDGLQAVSNKPNHKYVLTAGNIFLINPLSSAFPL
jgi:hypothetical protein